MGSALVLFAIAALVRPNLINAAIKEFDHESVSTLAIGFMTVIAGLAVVLSHNVWDGSWRTIVTLLGWASLIKGFVYLAAPHYLMRMSHIFLRHTKWMRGYMVAALLLGLYVAYKGFGY